MSYKLNDWSLSDVTYVLPKIGDPIGKTLNDQGELVPLEYVIFDIPDLATAPATYVSQIAGNTDNGNSVEIVADLSDVDSGSYLTMYIDDGTNRQGIKIYNGYVTLLDGSSQQSIHNPAGELHRYTITLQGNHFQFLFDKEYVIEVDNALPAVEEDNHLVIGFPEEQSGKFLAKFKYIKYTTGVYKYIVLDKVDFEFQVDSSPKFDSVNLHTYTKASFPTTTPDSYKAWDPVSYVCGNPVVDEDGNTTYDGKGLVTAITVKLPRRPDMEWPTFYYRVKFQGDYESEYSTVYYNDKSDVTPFSKGNLVYYTRDGVRFTLLPGYVFIYDSTLDRAGKADLLYTVNDAGFHQVISLTEGSSIKLPAIPVPDNWKITIMNTGNYAIPVFDDISQNEEDGKNIVRDPIFTVEPSQIVSFQFDTADNKWYTYVEHNRASFDIRPDFTSEIFKAVYGSRIPADNSDVYTKDYDTGTLATIVRAESREVSNVINETIEDTTRVGSYTTPNDTFIEKWGDVYKLSGSLFKNTAEMRDVLQQLQFNSYGEMMYNYMITIIDIITGAKPKLIEYKDKKFNVIYSTETIKKVPLNQRFYIYDPEHPSYTLNPFVVYGGNAQAYTFQLDIYDPYDLKYSDELIRSVIDMFKPGWTQCVVNRYDSEGDLQVNKYFYSYDNYNEAAYNS